MRKGVLFITAIVLILAGAYWYKTYSKATKQINCNDCNIVLIVIDPLRSDGLQILGNPRETTPTLDALANSGFLFTNAMAVSSWTLPSAMSLVTGTYPSVHKIINKELIGKTQKEGLIPANLKTASPQITTLASILKSRGYATGGFTGGAALDTSSGFDEGFDTYVSSGDFVGLPTVMPKALDFVRANVDKKLFLFLHGFDTHGQFVPESGYDRRFVDKKYNGKLTGSAEEQKALREQGVLEGRIYLTDDDVQFLRAIYDEKVARLDRLIGQFLDSYRGLNMSRKTLFIITSDHGEEFYEHGRIDHGMTLYDEVLHVPLIIVMPGVDARGRIADQVRNIDIMPTILSLVGIQPTNELRAQMTGTSLVPFMKGAHERLDIFPETQYRYATFQKAIRRWDGWKLIVDEDTTIKRLFDTTHDPYEQDDKDSSVSDIEDELFMSLIQHDNLLNNDTSK